MTNPTSIKKEYLSGKSVISISEEYGISRERVYQILRSLKDWGDVKDEFVKSRNDDYSVLAQEVKEMVESGKTLIDSLNDAGISRATFYKYCPEMKGYYKRNSDKLTKKIVDDWMAGISYRNLSSKYKINVYAIQNRLRGFYGDIWEEAKKLRAEKLK